MGRESSCGTIITFYSYKGGTGRSMILANVAWMLASAGKRILAIDWDLEAPGLHRYFSPFLIDKSLTASEGVIDFVFDYAMKAMSPPEHDGDKEWDVAQADILKYAVSLEWPFPDGGTLDFVPAGKQDDLYSKKVSSFNWQDFYERFGGGRFLDLAKAKMQAEYDYILIDSRTGVSDSSGICTVQMPDTVVICYILNNQSIEGTASVARSILAQRPDIRLFPVPMRLEPFEKNKLDLRRELAKNRFEDLLSHMQPDIRKKFTAEIQFPYIPYYAYEEILVAFGDKPGETGTLLSSTERLVDYLIDDELQAFKYPTALQREQFLALYERPESSTTIPIDSATPVRWFTAYKNAYQKWGPSIWLAAAILIYTSGIVASSFTRSLVLQAIILILGISQLVYIVRNPYLRSKKTQYTSLITLSVVSVILFLVWLGFAGGPIISSGTGVGKSEAALRDISKELNEIRERYRGLSRLPANATEVGNDAATVAAKLVDIPDEDLGDGMQIFKYESLAYAHGIVAGSEIIASREFTDQEKLKSIQALFNASEKTQRLIQEVRRPQPADEKLQKLRAWLRDDDADQRLQRLTAVGLCFRWQVKKDPKDRTEARDLVNTLPAYYRAREHPEQSSELAECVKGN